MTTTQRSERGATAPTTWHEKTFPIALHSRREQSAISFSMAMPVSSEMSNMDE